MARPTPVFPEVGSTMVPPGRSAPEASAASTIRSAIRSLTEPPGLKYSTLASTAGACPPPTAFVTARSLTSGVFPTSSIRDSWTCIATTLIGTTGSVMDAQRAGGPPGRAQKQTLSQLTSMTVPARPTRG